MNTATQLSLGYPVGATLQEKLQIGSAKVSLTKLLERVAGLKPIGFTDSSAKLIDLHVAINECLRRDAPTLALLPEADVDRDSGRVLSIHAQGFLGTPAEGYLSILNCLWQRELSQMSCLPWLRVAVLDDSWADDLWRAGARDFVFVEPTNTRVFAVIHDDHDDEVTVVGAETTELVRRNAGRG